MRPEPLLRFSPFQRSTHVYSVGELALHIGGVLEADTILNDVWLRGDVVNVSRSAAGHYYFVLKDDDAQLRCVLFRGSAFNSPVMPANGLALVAHGVVRLYERQGSCELVADLLFPQAVGRLGRWQRDGLGIDVLVIARGGGSDDDLAAFNDERLARAIFASPVPVLSAVGHETNLTLSDLVADLRAPTPSAAAELLAPDVASLRNDVRALRRRATQALKQQVSQRRRAVMDVRRRLNALSPAATLSRGYAIVESDGRVLHDATTVGPGARLRIQLHRGRLASRVDAVEPES